MQANELEVFYNHCPHEIKASVLKRTFLPGDRIIERSPGRHVYLLTSGAAKAYHLTPSGMIYIVYIYGAWELFGEVEALNGRNSVCNIEAISRCSVLEIENIVFIKWLQLDFSFTRYILNQLSDKIYSLSETAPVDIVYPLEYRFLMLIWNRLVKSRSCAFPFTKEIFAECMGTNLRSLNRIIKDLTERNVIGYKNGVLSVESQENLLNAIRKYSYDSYCAG